MTVLFATLGFTPEKVLPSVRARERLEGVVLFHDRADASRDAGRRVQKALDDLGVPCRAVEVDAFDVAESARAVKRELVASRGSERVFNISGGTRVLSSAALLACIVEGVRVVYVHDQSRKEVPLPLLTIPYERLINAPKRRVLEAIRDAKGTCTQSDLVSALGLARATVSYHVNGLKEMGLLEAYDLPDGRTEGLRLIPTADLLLDDALTTEV